MHTQKKKHVQWTLYKPHNENISGYTNLLILDWTTLAPTKQCSSTSIFLECFNAHQWWSCNTHQQHFSPTEAFFRYSNATQSICPLEITKLLLNSNSSSPNHLVSIISLNLWIVATAVKFSHLEGSSRHHQVIDTPSYVWMNNFLYVVYSKHFVSAFVHFAPTFLWQHALHCLATF